MQYVDALLMYVCVYAWSNCVWEYGPHPEVCKLKSDLNEGVRAGAALLDEALAKFTEGDDVAVHVVRQGLGHIQGAVDDGLALGEDKSKAWN